MIRVGIHFRKVLNGSAFDPINGAISQRISVCNSLCRKPFHVDEPHNIRLALFKKTHIIHQSLLLPFQYWRPAEIASKGPARKANCGAKEKAITEFFQILYTEQ